MRQRTKRLLAALLIVAAALSLFGCGGTKRPIPSAVPEPTETAAPAPAETVSPTPEPTPTPEPKPGKIVCIDPGHQRVGSAVPEPIGPGAAETKARVTGGAQGRFTGVPEYELNLAVSLLLRDILTQRGYTVVMTRDRKSVV